jgi:hypothetical protein
MVSPVVVVIYGRLAIVQASAILLAMDSGQFTIKLTADETELSNAIEFNAIALRDYIHAEANGELVYKLTSSLLKRSAIPAQRVKYFTDPEYNSSDNRKSRKTAFIQNSRTEEKMIRHPHFLKYLRYFIHGADLPTTIIKTFVEALKESGQIISGEIEPLSSLARRLVRSNKLDPNSSADEFYKLCLDLNLSHYDAGSIRSSVKKIIRKT